MTIEHDISGCLASKIGEDGLSDSSYKTWFDRASDCAGQLRREINEESLRLASILTERDDIDLARDKFLELIEGADTVVFFGTGGSSLGGQTIAQLGGWFIPGEDVKSARKMPRTRIYDNLDPRSLAGAISLLDLEKTRFVAISKSGNTAETLAQMIVAIKAMEDAGYSDRIGERVLGLSGQRTVGGKNGLRDLLDPYNVPFLDHEDELGGRYSVFSNVGLLFAIARGLDPVKLREGAFSLVSELVQADTFENFMPVVGAAINVGLCEERYIQRVVMMPYANQLQTFASWFAQLWAESLGKNLKGTTPIVALGPVDQHSQLQLYMDGPIDKLVTIIVPEIRETGPLIPEELAARAGIDYLGGHRVGDLVMAGAVGTSNALQQAGRPVRFIQIPALDETVLGYLLMSFMIETIIAADLFGVDAFDQPAVELGKIISRDYFKS